MDAKIIADFEERLAKLQARMSSAERAHADLHTEHKALSEKVERIESAQIKHKLDLDNQSRYLQEVGHKLDNVVRSHDAFITHFEQFCSDFKELKTFLQTRANEALAQNVVRDTIPAPGTPEDTLTVHDEITVTGIKIPTQSKLPTE